MRPHLYISLFQFFGFFFFSFFLFSHIFFDLIFTTLKETWYVGVRSHLAKEFVTNAVEALLLLLLTSLIEFHLVQLI